MPGYWSLNRNGYFWVPGACVGAVHRRAVDAGLLGFRGRHLSVARRLLGPHIGFYGGINYGFGYIGIGFVGGYWDHDRYFTTAP